jgi:hypothetical protein
MEFIDPAAKEREIFDMMVNLHSKILESSKYKIENETDVEKLRYEALRLHGYANSFVRSVLQAIK